jgi:hypothetical protein
VALLGGDGSLLDRPVGRPPSDLSGARRGGLWLRQLLGL